MLPSIFWMTFGKDLKAWCGKSLKLMLGFKHITEPIDQCLNDSSPQFCWLFTTDVDEICQPKKGFVSSCRTPANNLRKGDWKMN